ncbi:MAG: hypothetical protein V4805_13175 [Pseudomonadota bacterium]
MPIRTIPAIDAKYHMVVVNQDGVENASDPDVVSGPISATILGEIKTTNVTDVFIWTHGWKGDMPAAFDQYDRWIGAFSRLDADRQKMVQKRGTFKEFHIGFHWPSLEWGDENPVSGTSFSISDAPVGQSVQSYVDLYADRLGDSPAVRVALTKLFADLAKNAAKTQLTPLAREAYLELEQALGFGGCGSTADRASFDPDLAVKDAFTGVSFGAGSFSRLLSPLQQLTFWTMKKRAQTVGENGLHPLLNKIQDTAPGIRIHLMGHSFGCIVTCAGLGGPEGNSLLRRPVDSCVLVQGAMSLWAFAQEIPVRAGVAGYFCHLRPDGKVSGPIVTTRSVHDLAVGKLYPWAAGVANQISFGLADLTDLTELPKFGGIGTFGIQGLDIKDDIMKAADAEYDFTAKTIYNLESSAFIAKRDGLSGAHSDIDGPEVAHVLWQAAMTA